MKNIHYTLIVLSLCLSACTTPQMLLQEQLASETTPMPVRGRQGWLMHQQLTFGKYRAENVERGWTFSYGIDLLLTELQAARQKFSFTLIDEQEQRFTVMSAHQLKGLEIPLNRFAPQARPAVQGLLSLTVQTQDMMAATLYDHQQQTSWHMLMMHPDDLRKNGKYVGLLSHESAVPIHIVPVRKLTGQKIWGGDIVGFEFQQEGRTLAAVETLNQGRIWIHQNLETEQQMLLAAACATLLLQEEITLPSEEL